MEWKTPDYYVEIPKHVTLTDSNGYEDGKKEHCCGTRELMQYYNRDDSLKEKVKTLEITVAEKDGELKGCAVAELVTPLNQQEFGKLRDYLSGQYSDGWGEGFEQEDIQVEEGTLNVHFSYTGEYEILHELSHATRQKKNIGRER